MDRRSAQFTDFLKALEERSDRGEELYLYCLDDGIQEIDFLLSRGGARLRVFGCAYAALRRSLPRNPEATYGGLGLLADLILGTDELLAF